MTDRLILLREAIRRPLPLAYHPLYRFYEGGSLTRPFRGLPGRPDDWWSEDWVGSCTRASNDDPDGRPQGLSLVDLPGVGPIALSDIIEALPEEMVGARFAERHGTDHRRAGQAALARGPGAAARPPDPRLGPAAPRVPVRQDRGVDPARHAGRRRRARLRRDRLRPGIDRDWFAAAVRRHDNAAIRGTLHRTDVHPGEVYVAHAGVPHYLGPRISFIEVQEPSDHIVIPETSGDDDAGATMGLGWDLALDMIDYTGADAGQTFARARQQPRVLRTSHGSREVRLLADDVLPFFDATALEVADEIEVSDGRFSIAIVVSGAGSIEGDFGGQPIGRGETFALPASLPFRVRAGREPVRVVRCLGPAAE